MDLRKHGVLCGWLAVAVVSVFFMGCGSGAPERQPAEQRVKAQRTAVTTAPDEATSAVQAEVREPDRTPGVPFVLAYKGTTTAEGRLALVDERLLRARVFDETGVAMEHRVGALRAVNEATSETVTLAQAESGGNWLEGRFERPVAFPCRIRVIYDQGEGAEILEDVVTVASPLPKAFE
ncbi:MAG: hypothetical protein N2111_14235 [Candidatus Sumerlaeaceae bacterium]|nr:hypothetical protein [Candidatus Sumerlaeaceae bacterium]